MNCDDISSILNLHETASLDAARRAAADAHLSTCCDCRGAWRVAHALRRERWPGAPAGLLSKIAGDLDTVEAGGETLVGGVFAVEKVVPGVCVEGVEEAAWAVSEEVVVEQAPRRRPEAARHAPRWMGPVALLAASVAVVVGIGVWLADRPAPERELRVDVSTAAELPEQQNDALSNARRAPSNESEGATFENGAPRADRGAPTDESESPAGAFELGRHYRLVANADLPAAQSSVLGAPANATLAGATPILVEVIHFFMYGCWPCFAFEPQVDGWETKAEYVDVLRVPVVFNATAELHARAFYTAEALGTLDEMHAALFREIHERGNRLDNEAAIAGVFARFGIDEEAFRRVYRSPEIDAKVEAGIELARSFGVTATPSLVVGRRYLTSPAMTGSYEDAFAVVDALARSIYDVRRSDRCAPTELAEHARRLQEFRDRQSIDERPPAAQPAAERPRAEGGGPLAMQQLIDLVSRGCASDAPPADRIF